MTVFLKICMENWKRSEEIANKLLELKPEQLYFLGIWVEATKNVLNVLTNLEI